MARLDSHDQHFLQSPKIVAELIGHSNIRKNDTVYDLGAGSGIISAVLARRCKQVVAVETEPNALQKLRRNMTGINNVAIRDQDILTITPSDDHYKIFANIPFSMSSAIVTRFTELANTPVAMYLITQRQFARKLVPGKDHFTNLMSAQLGPLFSVRIRKPLRKTDFTPPPAVDTVLLEIKLRETPLIARDRLNAYRRFVHRCFTEQAYFISQPREKAGISAEKIPSQLTLEQWQRLFETK